MSRKRFVYTCTLILLILISMAIGLRIKAQEPSPGTKSDMPVASIKDPELAIVPEDLTPEQRDALVQDALNELWRYAPNLETDHPESIVIAADNGQIAYVGTDKHLYIMNPDGTAQQKILDTPSNIAYPAWSHDSQYLAFVADGEGGRCLYKFHLSTKTRSELYCGTSKIDHPEWSPEDTRIAFFVKNADVFGRAWALNSDGSNLTELAPNMDHNWHPVWKNEDTIVFPGETSPDVWQLYEVEFTQPTSPQAITPQFKCSSECNCGSDDGWLVMPDISESGRIAFVGARTEGSKNGCVGYYAVYVVDGTNNQTRKIIDIADTTPGNAMTGLLRWAPDDRHLAVYGSGSDGVQRLNVIDISEGTKTVLHGRENGGWNGFDWAPDGSKLQLATGFVPDGADPEVDSVDPKNDIFTALASGRSPAWGTKSVPQTFDMVIEINQVLGRQYSAPPRYVAGKDTAIRVFLTTPVNVDSSTQQVVVRRDGELVTTLEPSPSIMPTDTLTFLCPSLTACGKWQAGKYTFEVTVNGFSKQAAATIQPTKSLNILAVPVRVNDQGNIREPSNQWKAAWRFLSHVYPVASGTVGVDWKPMGQPLIATNYDLTKECVRDDEGYIVDGRCRLWKDLELLRPRLCQFPGLGGASCYDNIVGFIPAMLLECTEECDKCACQTGFAPIKENGTHPTEYRAVVVMENGSFKSSCKDEEGDYITKTVNSMYGTVAHEVGHTFGLGDEYENPNGAYQCTINPPPPNYRGRHPDLPLNSGCEGNYWCPNSIEQPWPIEKEGSGVTIPGEVYHPFELRSTVPYQPARGPLLGKRNLLNFMGSGHQSDLWISPRVYEHLFSQFVQTTGTGVEVAASEMAVLASGWIGQDDSVVLEPWYSYTATLGSPVTGTYTIEAVDAMSQTLASQGFEVSFISLSNPPFELEFAPFEAVVAFPSGTRSFQIKHGDTLLEEVPVSPNKPTVTVTAPAGGQAVSGIFPITWQSNDLDGDQLYHTVEYSHDGQNWLTLAAIITETQFTADFDLLPGSDQALVKVIVSDGIRTTEATSAPFVVGLKAPEVFIDSPVHGDSYTVGMNMTLSGSAYDYQDGWLHSDEALEWSSDQDGVLGNGEMLNLHNLSLGEHNIKLSATNSHGLTTTADVTVTVTVINQLYLPIVLKEGS